MAMTPRTAAWNQARALLQDPDAFTTALMALLIDRFSTEMTEWTDETILQEVRDEFQVDLPTDNLGKIRVGIGLLTTDDFYKRPYHFIQYCNVLSGDEFNPGRYNDADAYECAWGITEALLLDPPEEEEEPFDEIILWYIGSQLDRAGIKNPPDILRIALREEHTADYGGPFAEDPVMFAAEFENQQEEAQNIERMLQQNLAELLDQLEQLPLETGDAKDRVNELRSGLSFLDESGKTLDSRQ